MTLRSSTCGWLCIAAHQFQNLGRSPRSPGESVIFPCVQRGIGRHAFVTTATPASESTRGAMKSPIRQCGLLLMAFTVCAEPALAAGSYLNCQTKKAIIIDAPNGKSSLSTEENVGFWIDEAAKTITLEDGTPLIVRRFDDRWISAARGR